MKYGAGNNITAKVTSIKRDKIMALVKFDATTPAKMAEEKLRHMVHARDRLREENC